MIPRLHPCLVFDPCLSHLGDHRQDEDLLPPPVAPDPVYDYFCLAVPSMRRCQDQHCLMLSDT